MEGGLKGLCTTDEDQNRSLKAVQKFRTWHGEPPPAEQLSPRIAELQHTKPGGYRCSTIRLLSGIPGKHSKDVLRVCCGFPERYLQG